MDIPEAAISVKKMPQRAQVQAGPYSSAPAATSLVTLPADLLPRIYAMSATDCDLFERQALRMRLCRLSKEWRASLYDIDTDLLALPSLSAITKWGDVDQERAAKVTHLAVSTSGLANSSDQLSVLCKVCDGLKRFELVKHLTWVETATAIRQEQIMSHLVALPFFPGLSSLALDLRTAVVTKCGIILRNIRELPNLERLELYLGAAAAKSLVSGMHPGGAPGRAPRLTELTSDAFGPTLYLWLLEPNASTVPCTIKSLEPVPANIDDKDDDHHINLAQWPRHSWIRRSPRSSSWIVLEDVRELSIPLLCTETDVAAAPPYDPGDDEEFGNDMRPHLDLLVLRADRVTGLFSPRAALFFSMLPNLQILELGELVEEAVRDITVTARLVSLVPHLPISLRRLWVGKQPGRWNSEAMEELQLVCGARGIECEFFEPRTAV